MHFNLHVIYFRIAKWLSTPREGRSVRPDLPLMKVEKAGQNTSITDPVGISTSGNPSAHHINQVNTIPLPWRASCAAIFALL